MNITGIAAVMNRVADIERKVGFVNTGLGQSGGGTGFESMLDQAVKNQGRQTAAVRAPEKSGKSPLATLPGSDVANGYGDLIRESAYRHGVDPGLVSAVAKVESGYDQNAVSSAGALGVMQLMPDTAAGLGVDPADVRQNIDGGAKYLRQQLDHYGGDIAKALAAYNAGSAAVDSYGGVPPYGETIDYVDKVLSLYRQTP